MSENKDEAWWALPRSASITVGEARDALENLTKENNNLKEELKKTTEVLEKAETAMQHAYDLDYFNKGGSTELMIINAITDCIRTKEIIYKLTKETK